MQVVESEAVVLQVRDHGESDRLVSFYTASGGKRQGIAKGARNSRKRFVHAFEPCSLVALVYHERKSFLWIESCRLLEPHLNLRAELNRWCFAALVSEIILEMAPDGESQPDLFLLFKETLERLTHGRDPLNVLLLFMLRFLHLMGYLPALEKCGVCQRTVGSGRYWGWGMREGLLTCPKHLSANPDGLELDMGTLVLIKQSRRLPLSSLWRLHFLQHQKSPLLHGLLDWVRSQIRKDLKSLRLFEQLSLAQ
jgi:DNA repair protein RecO (recombination protein O)